MFVFLVCIQHLNCQTQFTSKGLFLVVMVAVGEDDTFDGIRTEDVGFMSNSVHCSLRA